MNITILDDYQNAIPTLDCFSLLAGHRVTVHRDHVTDLEPLAERLADTQALCLIRERTPIRAPLLKRLPNLRLISQTSVYPHIDVEACTQQRIIVSSHMGGGQPSYATAELCWGLIIAAMRRIPQEMAALKAGRWQSYPVGLGLRGKTLAIWGYGRLGRVVASYGKAFGMDVIVWAREAARAQARADGLRVAADKSELFAQADVLSLHLRLLPETTAVVTAADLALMKPTAVLVNTSRAGLIESGALITALRAGRPGFAAIDVFDREPAMPGQEPLLAMENVVCTPHLGYVERDGLESSMRTIFEQVLAYAAGHPINVVNPQALNGPRP